MSAVPVKDKIEYTVSLVSDFAKRYSLSTIFKVLFMFTII